MAGTLTRDEILKSGLPIDRKVFLLDMLGQTTEYKLQKEKERSKKLGRDLGEAEARATTDPLTEALNLRYKGEILEHYWRQLQYRGKERRAPELLSVVIFNFDLNDFKRLNDELGHQAGDNALQLFTQRIREITRPREDSLFRKGGDEFLLVMPIWDGTKEAEIDPQKLANSIIGKLIENLHVPVSIGVAIARKGEKRTIDEVLETADKKMYEEKRKTKRQQAGRMEDPNQYELGL